MLVKPAHSALCQRAWVCSILSTRNPMANLGKNFCMVAVLALTSCAAVRQFPDDPAPWNAPA